MQVNPVIHSISFEMKYHRKIYSYGTSEKIKDYIFLDNGSKVSIISYKEQGSLTMKLMSLKNNLGQWVKSKLKYYKGRKVAMTINSYAEGDK